MKLSDALRGAADRAPVDGATVSTSAAAGKVRRQRALRAGANGMVGVGAVAVLGVAVVYPVSSRDSGDDLDRGGAAAPMEESAMDGAFADSGESSAALTRPADPWMCGADFSPTDGIWTWGDASGVDFAVDEPAERDGETWLEYTLTATDRTVELVSSAPDVVVTWDGIVVGYQSAGDPFAYGPADEPLLDADGTYEWIDAGDSLEQATVLDVVNCWDGEPLPAGEYEVHQAWTLGYGGGDATDPGDGEEPPSVDPALPAEPDELPTEETPGDSGDSGSGEETAEGSGAASSDDAVDSDQHSNASSDAPLPPEDVLSNVFRVGGGPVGLVIEGEPVDDPFGDYLAMPEPLPEPGEPLPEPQPLPDGYLSPDIARDLFADGLTAQPWNMAAGTQRWVKVNDARSTSPDGDWQKYYFGCTWGDQDGGTFPAESAQLDLIDYDVNLPSSISVDYGYVVQDNPEVTSAVRNVSEYTIPGLWGGEAPQLYLVQNGRVVAQAYPESVDRGMFFSGIERGQADGDIAGDGVLEPGESINGTYLWRDVSACGDGDRLTDVRPGTYTVLAAATIYVGNEGYVMYGGGTDGAEGSIAYDDAGDAEFGASEPAVEEPALAPTNDLALTIAPAPDGAYDWVELQSWTSLGTVIVR